MTTETPAATAAPSAKLDGMSRRKKILFALLPALVIFGGLEAGLWIDGFEYDGSSRMGVAMAGESKFWRANTVPDPDAIYRFKPAQNRAPLGEHPPFPHGARRFDINEHGYRGPSYPQSKSSSSTTRVLAYGDSVTFGMYLPLEETYPWRLQERLRAEGLDVDVLNMGLSSYTSAQNLWDFEARGDAFQPDVLLLHIGVWNDFSVPSNRRPDSEVRDYLRQKKLLAENFFLRNVKTAQLLFKWKDSIAKDLVKLRPKPAKKSSSGHRYAEEDQVRRVPIDEFQEIVDRFLAMAEERDLAVLVVAPALSSKTMASLGHVANEYHAALMAVEQSDRVKVVDLRPVVAANGGDALFFDNCHYNAAGCGVVADALAEPLAQLARRKGAVETAPAAEPES